MQKHHPSQCHCDGASLTSITPHDRATALQKLRSKSVSPLVLLPMDVTNLDISFDTSNDTTSASYLNQNFSFPNLLPVSSSLSSPQVYQPSIPSLYSQPSRPLNVLSALYMNGLILGLTCSSGSSSRSPMPSPHHPLPLHPTQTQMHTVHPQWYDRLPFPRMRDSLIRLMGVVDEEDLIKDLYLMPSWRIEVGDGDGADWERRCWDPRFWVMEEGWRDKWGWLMV